MIGRSVFDSMKLGMPNLNTLTTSCYANFFSPNGHWRQSFVCIISRHFGLKQCGFKGFPNTAQLMTRSIELGWKFQINTVPGCIFRDGMGLLVPLGHIGLQEFIGGDRFFQTFGRQHFNALRQQHGCFTLHHDLVLQIFHGFDFFIQLKLEAGQGFARQRRTCFGGISLPCHGIGNVQTRRRQHGIGAFSPFSRQHILAMSAL